MKNNPKESLSNVAEFFADRLNKKQNARLSDKKRKGKTSNDVDKSPQKENKTNKVRYKVRKNKNLNLKKNLKIVRFWKCGHTFTPYGYFLAKIEGYFYNYA